VPNCKSFLVIAKERKHVRRRALFQQHRGASCHQAFLFPCKARRRRKFTPFWQKHYENTHHRMPPPKTGWPCLNVVIFPPGWPKTVTAPEIIDQIHELILEDRRISAKSIAEQLGTSRERVGSVILEDLDKRELSAKWVSKCLNADQKRQRCQSVV